MRIMRRDDDANLKWVAKKPIVGLPCRVGRTINLCQTVSPYKVSNIMHPVTFLFDTTFTPFDMVLEKEQGRIRNVQKIDIYFVHFS